jgi:hypothetical protein
MEIESVYKNYLDESDVLMLSQSVHSGYWAVDHLYKINPVFGMFKPGLDQRPRLINLFVEHNLTKIDRPGFHYEIQKNVARNCSHVRLRKDKMTITTHFLGSTAPRKMARFAKYRMPLAGSNYDLFDLFNNDESDKDNFEGDIYCHLYHYGLRAPSQIFLAAPRKNQFGLLGKPLILPTIEKRKEDEEKIEESLDLILRTISDEYNYKEKNN